MSSPALQLPLDSPTVEPQALSEKADLWQHIREAHPQLAMAMLAAKHQSDPYVSLQGLPPTTRRWLWDAIKTWHPALAQLLEDSPLATLKQTFEGSYYELRLDDVVRALSAAHNASRQPLEDTHVSS